MKQCVGVYVTPRHHRLMCHCLSTYCRCNLVFEWRTQSSFGLQLERNCLCNFSYIKHSLWALCDLYVNVESWRTVFNQLSTVFIPDTGRVHSLFIFFKQQTCPSAQLLGLQYSMYLISARDRVQMISKEVFRKGRMALCLLFRLQVLNWMSVSYFISIFLWSYKTMQTNKGRI